MLPYYSGGAASSSSGGGSTATSTSTTTTTTTATTASSDGHLMSGYRPLGSGGDASSNGLLTLSKVAMADGALFIGGGPAGAGSVPTVVTLAGGSAPDRTASTSSSSSGNAAGRNGVATAAAAAGGDMPTPSPPQTSASSRASSSSSSSPNVPHITLLEPYNHASAAAAAAAAAAGNHDQHQHHQLQLQHQHMQLLPPQLPPGQAGHHQHLAQMSVPTQLAATTMFFGPYPTTYGMSPATVASSVASPGDHHSHNHNHNHHQQHQSSQQQQQTQQQQQAQQQQQQQQQQQSNGNGNGNGKAGENHLHHSNGAAQAPNGPQQQQQQFTFAPMILPPTATILPSHLHHAENAAYFQPQQIMYTPDMQPYYLTTTGAGPQQTTQYFVPAQYYEAATLDHHHQALALASPHQHHSSAAAAAMHLSSPNGMHHHHHGHNHNHNHNHGAHLMPQVPPADLETFSSALSTMHGQVSGFLVEEDHKRTPKSKGGARRNVTCACLPCRQAHVSCSETRPCPRCVRKGIECVDLSATAKKRGPKPGAKRRNRESSQHPGGDESGSGNEQGSSDSGEPPQKRQNTGAAAAASAVVSMESQMQQMHQQQQQMMHQQYPAYMQGFHSSGGGAGQPPSLTAEAQGMSGALPAIIDPQQQQQQQLLPPPPPPQLHLSPQPSQSARRLPSLSNTPSPGGLPRPPWLMADQQQPQQQLNGAGGDHQSTPLLSMPDMASPGKLSNGDQSSRDGQLSDIARRIRVSPTMLGGSAPSSESGQSQHPPRSTASLYDQMPSLPMLSAFYPESATSTPPRDLQAPTAANGGGTPGDLFPGDPLSPNSRRVRQVLSMCKADLYPSAQQQAQREASQSQFQPGV